MPHLGPTLVDLAAYVSTERVRFLASGLEKPVALRELAELTASHPSVTDRGAFLQAIYEREEVSSTGIGGGIAVPHAKIPSVAGFVISIGISRAGIDFKAKDQRPVHLLVMIAASDSARDTYLKVLATVAARLKNEAVCRSMREAPDGAAVISAMLAV